MRLILETRCLIVVLFFVIGFWVLRLRIFYTPSFNKDTQAITQTNGKTKPQNGNIGKVIHQSWKVKNVPKFFENLTYSWTHTCFKDWQYMFWTDDDNYRFIKTKFSWFLPTYEKLGASIYKADVSRYFYLYEYGGIYTDIDNECLRPFENLLGDYDLVFGAMKGQYGGTSLKEGYVQNSFMYSKPKLQFWMSLVKLIQNKVASNQMTVPEALTGPILLSNLIREQRRKGNLTIANLKIYEPNYFNPYSWMAKNESPKECKDFNRMKEGERRVCKIFFYKRGSYVVQYHAHTWG